jgi:hypothetical protein
MGYYTKLPVTIEAHQWDGTKEDAVAIIDWIVDHDHVARYHGTHEIYIETLEGTMLAEPRDWVIRGVKNEFYPCKPDIFDATYAPATIHAEIDYER